MSPCGHACVGLRTGAEVEQLLLDRQTVRLVVMRGTVHLFAADEARSIRRITQPVMDCRDRAALRAQGQADRCGHGAGARGGRDGCFAVDGPLYQPGAAEAALAAAFPELTTPPALAYACRCYLPLVQVPPRGLWSRSGTVRTTDRRPLAATGSTTSSSTIDDLLVRYLAAFGPATIADFASWSRLTGMREVVERDRARLAVYRDERGSRAARSTGRVR